MKNVILTILPLIFLTVFTGNEVLAQKDKKAKSKKGKVETTSTMDLKNETDSISYALGIDFGNNLKSAELKDLNGNALATAAEAVIKGDSTVMSREEAKQVIQNYFMKIQMEKEKKQMDWLAENGKKTGVITLPSGLQYKVIKSGSGATPGSADKVTTHYEGKLIDGTIFDSSFERGQPASFGVTQVIKGWTEALQLMKEGDEWELYIPHNLAYGPQGRPSIPPFSTLIFKIQLISVNQ